MPLGGKESGLFRFPRVGEKVLVGTEEGTHYLMGYIPTYTNPETRDFQTAGMFQDNGQGEVFRYRQTGKKEGREGKDLYSEIGFYNRQTQWPTINSSYRGVPSEPPSRKDKDDAELSDKDYSALLVSSGYPKNEKETDAAHINRIMTPTVFPSIDQINIQSTGDLYTGANNHHRVKAKRFELLVNCNDTIHNKEELEKDELPLGDNPGDDSVLHAGDVHIRAGNRVVIKAAREITLQVGKNVLTISESGLDMISKIVNSNIANGFDATFSMAGKDGISLFGLDVDISSNKSFSIGDAFGGGISSNLGIVSIDGREIKAEVYDSTQFASTIAFVLINYIQNTKAGAEAIQGKSLSFEEVMDYGQQSIQILMSGYKLYNKITGLWKKYKNLMKAKADAAIEAAKQAEEAARKADDETLEAAKKADEKAEAAKKAADDEANATKVKADADLLDGKITPEEAEKIKADADAKAVKAKADADADAIKAKADADADAIKTKAEGTAVEEKIKAEEAAKLKKGEAEKEASRKKGEAEKEAAKKKGEAENEAAEKKKQANAEAEVAKKAADEEAENKKKLITEVEEAMKANLDESVADGSMSQEDADEVMKQMKDKSSKQIAQADADADDKKKQADANAADKKRQINEERDHKQDQADVDAAKAIDNADAEAENQKKQADVDAAKAIDNADAKAENQKKQADAKAENQKKQADVEAESKKKQADVDAAAKKAGGGTGASSSPGSTGSTGGTGNP
jgi:hypothetical protein